MANSTCVKDFTVGIIGGGIAGSTASIKLGEYGFNVHLFETGDSLVNGPPFCHLHSGGNLYREITDEQCGVLLRECLEIIKMYPYTVNMRPLLIAVPVCDDGTPADLLPRLRTLQDIYKDLVEKDSMNLLLGPPENYFQTYSKEDVKNLLANATPNNPVKPETFDDWIIPVIKQLDLEKLKFPLIMVQEYGWNMLRTAASAIIAVNKLKNCHVHLRSRVTNVSQIDGAKWLITYEKHNPETHQNITCTQIVDYLINACGFQTGLIDDMVYVSSKRMLEFKAAYICHWDKCDGEWPNVIIHGVRGTPNGMVQITPFVGKMFQLHGMTKDITLFNDGLVSTSHFSSQPKFHGTVSKIINSGWAEEEIRKRTRAAIDYTSRYVPSFKEAAVGGRPLYGVQQIPGSDPSLRTAGVCFEGQRYARMEIVKACSAITTSMEILKHLTKHPLFYYPNISDTPTCQSDSLLLNSPASVSSDEIDRLSVNLANERNYPVELAKMLKRI